MAGSFTAQQTASLHSRKFYCTADGFTKQQKVLPHNRKFNPAVETKEKFLLRQKHQSCDRNWQRQKQKSQFCSRNWRKVLSAAETEDKPTLQLLPLDLDSMFAHKPDQIELQLDQFQLLYSENLDLVPQEAAQPNITKRPTILKWRLYWGVGIKIGGIRYFSLANMFPSPYQSKTYRCS